MRHRLTLPTSRARSVVATIRVGRRPDAVAADWKAGRAYVVNSGEFTTAMSGSVSVLAPCPT